MQSLDTINSRRHPPGLQSTGNSGTGYPMLKGLTGELRGLDADARLDQETGGAVVLSAVKSTATTERSPGRMEIPRCIGERPEGVHEFVETGLKPLRRPPA